jgi:glycerol kinase
MILTIDEGTSSTRALVIDQKGQILGIKQKEIKQIYPQPLWVEHDPEEIWQASLNSARELITELLASKKISKSDIQGISITNQRETTIIWDPITSKPIYNAIVWQCKRTGQICTELKKNTALKNLISSKTGLLIDSYFSGTKIKWLLENIIKTNSKLANQELYFGTIDSWLIWKLTNGTKHLTDSTNASRTLLYDITKGSWSEEIISALGLGSIKLPQVQDSQSNFGFSSCFYDLLDRELPIITYGTGCFALVPVTSLEPTPGLLSSVAYSKNSNINYALEASIFMGGSIVQWLRDNLGIISSSSEIEAMALSVSDNAGVYFIPALTGLGAPHWIESAQGAIFGLTRSEAIAYQVADVFKILDLNSIDYINVDGGASKNDFLMQFQADLIKKPLKRYTEVEMTALGSAKMTGLIELDLQPQKIFEPKNNLDESYKQWQYYLNKIIN